MIWQNNIQGFIPQQDWLSIEFNPTRQSDPMDGLFGDTRTDNIMAAWQTIADEYQIPMMAQYHAFDTEAQKTIRVPVDTHHIEKGLIKVKIDQSERMRAMLRSGVQGDEAIYRYVVEDGVRLAEQVITRTKVAKAELMATGKVTIKENSLDISVDYGVPAENVALTLDLAEDADIPAQLQKIVDDASEKGKTITGMLTSRSNLSKLRANTAIQKAVNGTLGAGALVSNAALLSYLETEYGITNVVTDDLSYSVPDGVGADGRPKTLAKRYYPKDKVTFFAPNNAGRIGVGLWGDPPEADAAAYHQVSGSGTSPYVYLMQWMETDPAVLWTKASALFIPVLYNPGNLWVATVSDSGTTAPPGE